jgi:D-glycero-alpha-D-manno-heptose-7-phosphate kinase
MIITRTPFRISFFGGGTDYPGWFRENGGAVLATTFDKYCYISVRVLPPFFAHRHRLVYSRIENVRDLGEIQHPALREVLRFMQVSVGLEIHHDADLPARSGLGTSSSFTVGLLKALYALNGRMVAKEELSRTAIHVEQEVLRENVGCQDQMSAAYGGFNHIAFGPGDHIDVAPVTIPPERLRALEQHLMLFFTGFARYASDIAAEQVRNIPGRVSELRALCQMVAQGLSVLSGPADLSEFGRLLHEGWTIKKRLSSCVSTSPIDEIYDAARASGAVGGKLLGAGGGGFLLFFVPPERQPALKERLRSLLHVPFRFEQGGSQVIFYQVGTGR